MNSYVRVDVEVDTPEWQAERLHSLGASEVPAVLGLSSYGGTPLQVYKAKLGVPDAFPPLLAFVGHASERIIEEWVTRFAADEYPTYIKDFTLLRPGFMARSKDSPWLHASFDRISLRRNQIIPWQFKTAHTFAGHHWDEGVPVDVEAQVQAEMYVAGAPFAYVVVWIGGRDFKLFRLERKQNWIENHLLPKGRAFWQHVIDRDPPDPVTRAEIAEVYPSEAGRVEADADTFELVEQRDVLLADKKLIEAELEPLELGIGKFMGVADTLTRDGLPILTFKSQTGRRTVDFDKLQLDHPDAYADTVKFGRDFKVFRRIKQKETS